MNPDQPRHIDATVKAWFEAHPPLYGKRLMDVGAHDGVTLSNSRHLVLEGWDAVLVEAAAGPMVRLMENCRGKNKTKLVNAYVVGSRTITHPSRLSVLQHTGSLFSTSTLEVYNTWKTVVGDYFPVMVPVLQVASLRLAFPGPLDFVTIDTEGESFPIFCDLVEDAKISCICVEHTVAGVSCINEIRQLAFGKGFEELMVDEESVVFGNASA